MRLKSKQLLARISDGKVFGLFEHNCGANHIELKGSDQDDPVIRFDIYNDLDIKDGTIGFR